MLNDLKSALAALEAHQPGSLLGLRETQWLDAKSGPYQLADPKAVEELTKDVSAFANGGGGVIIVGIATRVEHDAEVLDHIVGLDPTAVNVDQIRKLIRQRITPTPRGVRVGWSGADSERVLFIEVPAPGVGRDHPRSVRARGSAGEADGRKRILTARSPPAGFDDRLPDRLGDGDRGAPGHQAQHPAWFAVDLVPQILQRGRALRPRLPGRLPQPRVSELLVGRPHLPLTVGQPLADAQPSTGSGFGNGLPYELGEGLG
ncbi:AlbA family DNA-binding domain-containing protein, partial [Streptomyces lancefieldiae]